MACGLPIVGTESVGMEELVTDGENGFLIPINAPEQLADRLAVVIDDPDLRARMGIKAREHALPYNWGIFAQRYETLFRAALETKDQ
jgi:glycosyltransferase involved in cell wall biosynthesis